MRKAIQIVSWLLPAFGLPLILGFAGAEQNNMPCSAISVKIDYSDENFFVDETDIREIIYSKGDSLLGKPVKEINADVLEKLILKNPSVKEAQVYVSVNGELRTEVEQRKPLVRIYNKAGESFYIDETGNVMPLSEKFASRVIIANGNISDTYAGLSLVNVAKISDSDTLAAKSVIDDIFALVNFIEKDEFWKANIQQIFINEKNEMEAVPRVGAHKIIVGDKQDLDAKFCKLFLLYQRGFSKTGWNQYTTINLKFKNQVICTKKN